MATHLPAGLIILPHERKVGVIHAGYHHQKEQPQEAKDVSSNPIKAAAIPFQWPEHMKINDAPQRDAVKMTCPNQAHCTIY